MTMTAKTFRKARVEAKIQQLHGISEFDEDCNQVALQWFKKDCRTFDKLAARLSEFTTDAKTRIAMYPL